MDVLCIVSYAIVIILFLVFIYKRLNDINNRNIENIGCTYLKSRNNAIFVLIIFLSIGLFFLWSLVILTMI